jgi:hypothetical protein
MNLLSASMILQVAFVMTYKAVSSSCPGNHFCKVCVAVKGAPNTCQACQDSFLDVTNECQVAPRNLKNCIAYSSTDKNLCSLCILGYMPNSVGECVECPKNCAECNNDGCTSCFNSVKPFDNSCSDGTRSCTGVNCQMCDAANKCIQCEEGFALSNFECLKSTSRCLQLGENSKCKECWEYYYLNQNWDCVVISQKDLLYYLLIVGTFFAVLIIIALIFKQRRKSTAQQIEDSYARVY